MLTEKIKKSLMQYDQKVPRYTSYPTANHFSSEFKPEDHLHWLTHTDDDQSLSLYLHIPFCHMLCHYCGCHTKIVNRYTAVSRYVQLLLVEIALVAEKFNTRKTVHYLHFGGGSPNMLNEEDFTRIVSTLNEYFDLDSLVEFSIELDPRKMTAGKALAYSKNGVNRVSLGVQDFNDKVQKLINRVQPYSLIKTAVEDLKDAGIFNINFDLMYGLPQQTMESVLENIRLSMEFKPSRIAFFGYAHVPQMKKHMRLINPEDLPDAALRLDMFQAGEQLLKENGYVAIGLDHFALPDDSLVVSYQKNKLCRNFQGYTVDTAEVLIGFGLSSISKLPQGYAQNTLDMRAYSDAIENQKLPVKKGVSISKKEHFIAKVIGHIMCYLQIDFEKICFENNEKKEDYTEVFKKLKELEELNLIAVDGFNFVINPEAKQISRYVCSLFDQHFKPEKSLHSKAF